MKYYAVIEKCKCDKENIAFTDYSEGYACIFLSKKEAMEEAGEADKVKEVSITII